MYIYMVKIHPDTKSTQRKAAQNVAVILILLTLQIL